MSASPTATSAPRVFGRSTEDLLDQVAWFNRLRLGAVAGMLLLTFVGADLLDAVEDPGPLYALAAVTLAVEIVYLRRKPRLVDAGQRAVRRHVDLQIAIDLLILTAILHFSGGVTNPLVLFYQLHAFIAALLLSLRAALVVVAASVALACSLTFLERSGVIAHHPLAVALVDLRDAPMGGVVAFLAAFGTTMLLSVYFVGTVLSRLVKREQQLVHVDRQLAQSEKLVSIGNLAAGVAHEINNPVGVIRSKVQILRHRIADGDAASTLLEELDTIEKHARRVGTITEGLLTFSRETPFSLEPLDLDRLVREGVELVAVPFRAAGVRLEMRSTKPAPRALGSKNHLLQVLVNVMLNAKDASPPGATVTVSTTVRGGEVGIVVEDRGAGIEPGNLGKVFDPFFTTKDVDRGTGLGLAISHGIIEKHRGRIGVESRLGKGSRFTVWLPAADGAPDLERPQP